MPEQKHIDQLFQDLEEHHPENFKPDENYKLKTFRKMYADELEGLWQYEKILKRKELVGKTLAHPMLFLGLFLVFSVGLALLFKGSC